MDELAKKRAEKRADSRLWTPVDALEDLLLEIKAGRVNPAQIAIHYFEGSSDEGYVHHYAAAGVTYPQHIALLTVGLQRTCQEWIK